MMLVHNVYICLDLPEDCVDFECTREKGSREGYAG